MFVLVEGERLDLRANVGGEDVLFVPERSILIFLLHFPGILGQLFMGKIGGHVGLEGLHERGLVRIVEEDLVELLVDFVKLVIVIVDHVFEEFGVEDLR